MLMDSTPANLRTLPGLMLALAVLALMPPAALAAAGLTFPEPMKELPAPAVPLSLSRQPGPSPSPKSR